MTPDLIDYFEFGEDCSFYNENNTQAKIHYDELTG
jgi:hypothetical protein